MALENWKTLFDDSLETLLERRIDPDPINLGSRRTVVSVTADAQKRTYKIEFPDFSFDNIAFVNLLTYSLPNLNNAFGLNTSAIEGDWIIANSQKEGDKRLVTMHQALEPHWSEFTRHVELFLNMLNLPAHQFSRDSFFHGIATKSQLTKRINELFHSPSYELYHKRGSQSLYAVQIAAITNYLNLTSPEIWSKRRVRKLTRPKKTQYLQEIANRGPAFVFRILDKKRLGYSAIIDEKDGSIFYQRSNSGKITVMGNRLRAEYENAWVEYEITLERLNQVSSGEFSRSTRPLITWSADHANGKRTYDTTAPHIQSDQNALLGLVATCYMSKSQRVILPEEMGLPGAQRKQQMREPQIPLLALVYRDKLLRGEIFERVEGLYHKS